MVVDSTTTLYKGKNMNDRLQYIRKEYFITDIAYLAGIVDGEGSIYIGKFSSNPKTGLPYYQTAMQVTNTDKGLIDWLFNTFGGLVSKRTEKQMPKNSRKQAYIWTATGERLTHLCELIKPFAICKKQQVEIMLEMRATYSTTYSQKGKQGLQPLPDEIRNKREELFHKIRSLHVRTYSYKNHN